LPAAGRPAPSPGSWPARPRNSQAVDRLLTSASVRHSAVCGRWLFCPSSTKGRGQIPHHLCRGTSVLPQFRLEAVFSCELRQRGT
jgi:hypothetical protein